MHRNLISVLSDNLDLQGDKTAILFKGSKDTFADIYVKAGRIAAALRSRGLKSGQRVGLLLPNIPEFVYAYFGILMAGGQVVPINVMLKPQEIEYVGNDSEIQYIIAQSDYVMYALIAKKSIPSIREVFCVGDTVNGSIPFDELINDPSAFFAVTPNPDDLAVIFYTSGTTGRPKGAMLTHANLYSNAIATAECYQYNLNDLIVFGMPMFHSSGQTNVMNAAFSRKSSLFLMPRFSVEGVLEAFKTYPVSVFVGVPTMYHQILNHPEAHQLIGKDLRVLIVGAAPLSEALFHAMADRFQVPITEGYGLSEAGPVVAHNPIDGKRKIGSVGPPITGVSVRVVDENETELGTDTVGELVVRGPSVMQGYLNQPEATREAIKGGWLHTGDLARIDEDDYIFIVDRKKDMILTGGFNIYPREIEEVVHIHPSVSEAAVIGIPDEERGELAAAYVILKPGQIASEQEIIDFCRTKMAVYKAPRRVFFVKELPRNPSGKVLKRLLK